MSTTRFSKAAALAVLDARATRIAKAEHYDRGQGTAQLRTPRQSDAEREKEDALIDRAVEYGRMRAYEDFACAIEEQFRHEVAP